MTRIRHTITCACCGKRGPSHARGLIATCYTRHQAHGALDRYPRLTGEKEPWTPTGPYGHRMLQRYQELAAIRPPMTKRAIAWHLDVTERSVERYAAALQAQQDQEAG